MSGFFFFTGLWMYKEYANSDCLADDTIHSMRAYGVIILLTAGFGVAKTAVVEALPT